MPEATSIPIVRRFFDIMPNLPNPSNQLAALWASGPDLLQ
jgi:hypothetical protein